MPAAISRSSARGFFLSSGKVCAMLSPRALAVFRKLRRILHPARELSRSQLIGGVLARTSIQLRSALLDELRPFGEVGEHKETKFLGRGARRLRAVGHDALAYVGPVENLDELVVQPRDDGLGQPGRPDHAVPGSAPTACRRN